MTNDLYAEVLRARGLHGLERGDLMWRGELHAALDQRLPPAERAVGLARHKAHLSIIVDVANETCRSLGDARALAMLAVLDGYALAVQVDGRQRARGKALKTGVACRRFAREAGHAGPALLAGVHGAVAQRLISELTPGPEDVHQLLANAMAAGVLLFQREHDVVLPDFASLVPASTKTRRTVKATVAHLEPPPEMLEAVLAAPQEDAPRLVLADWLSERGDPRGEFIQVQCELGRARFGADGRSIERARTTLAFQTRQDLEAREVALLRLHQRRWIEPLRAAVRQWGFRRGFVNRVTSDVTAFSGSLALARTPLEEVKLRGFRVQQLATLLRTPSHPTLQALDLWCNRIDDRASALFEAPLVAPVPGLDLGMNPLGPASMKVLARHTALRRLRLSYSGLTDEALAELARSRVWTALTHLELVECAALTSGGLVEAVNAAPRLEWLRLDGLSATEVLEVARAHPRLRHLSLADTDLGDATTLKVLEVLPALTSFAPASDVSEKVEAVVARRFGASSFPELFAGLSASGPH